MDFNDLTPELQAKAEACKTPEELLALAREEGYDLSDEELESISGGAAWDKDCQSLCREQKPCPQDCFYYGSR